MFPSVAVENIMAAHSFPCKLAGQKIADSSSRSLKSLLFCLREEENDGGSRNRVATVFRDLRNLPAKTCPCLLPISSRDVQLIQSFYNSVRPNQCKISGCHVECQTLSEILTHERECHGERRASFLCVVNCCRTPFAKSFNLERHLKSVHGKEYVLRKKLKA